MGLLDFLLLSMMFSYVYSLSRMGEHVMTESVLWAKVNENSVHCVLDKIWRSDLSIGSKFLFVK